MRRRLGLALALLLLAPVAQAFPDRPITLATGYAPGGSTDIAARILAERLAANLGNGARVVVENRPGAGGIVASEWLKRQAPGGHTIMLVESSSHAIPPEALGGGTPAATLAGFSLPARPPAPPRPLLGNQKEGATPDLPGATPAAVVQYLRA